MISNQAKLHRYLNRKCRLYIYKTFDFRSGTPNSSNQDTRLIGYGVLIGHFWNMRTKRFKDLELCSELFVTNNKF